MSSINWEIQEIFDKVVERTGESEAVVKKVLYNCANYLRDALQHPERPQIKWDGLMTFKLFEYRIERYVEKIESRKDDPRLEDEKDLAYYKGLLAMINKYRHGRSTRKKD